MRQICPHCNCWMLQHPKLARWLKCIACGFCRIEDEIEFAKAVQETMSRHHLVLKKLKDSGD